MTQQNLLNMLFRQCFTGNPLQINHVYWIPEAFSRNLMDILQNFVISSWNSVLNFGVLLEIQRNMCCMYWISLSCLEKVTGYPIKFCLIFLDLQTRFSYYRLDMLDVKNIFQELLAI